MKRFSISAAVLALAALPLHAQGPLAPPGAPAPAMKTLDQIEARTPIPKSPAVPVAGPHYTISQPGSYYLTGNIEVASGNGINISASNVTLDLNGFALISKTANPASGTAIAISNNRTGIEIRSGRITGGTIRTYTGPKPWNATFTAQGWTHGITGSDNILVSHLTVEGCGTHGILLGSSCALTHIAACGNAGSGIHIDGGSVTNAAVGNNGAVGLSANFGNVVNITAANNGGIGIDIYQGSANGVAASANGGHGINAVYGSISCATCNNNGGNGINAAEGCVTNSTVMSNGGIGILATKGAVTGSRASGNFHSGIVVETGVAAHCAASNNSADTTSVDKNIDVSASGQRIGCVPTSE